MSQATRIVHLTPQQQELLEDAEDLYQNSPSGYFSFRRNGKIFRINKTLLSWLGFTEEEVIDKLSFSDLVTLGGKLFYQNQFYPLLIMQGFVNEVNFEMRAKDGETFPVLVNAVRSTKSDDNFRATVIDISDRKKYEQQLLAQKYAAEDQRKRFENITRLLPEIVWTCSTNGTIDYMNDMLISYANAKHRNISGYRDIVHPLDYKKLLFEWKRAERSNSEVECELQLKNSSGIYFWFLLRAVCFKEEETGLKRWVGICINIDSQKKLVRKMDEFLSIASHELKTPLTTIKAYMQLLERTEIEPSLASYVTKTNKQVIKLQTLVNDLLDVSKIQSGQLKMELSEVSANTLLTDTVDSLRTLYPKHEMILVLPQKNIMIQCDRNRLEQVIINLINNGIKYSPQSNKIEVTLTEKNDKAEIAIRDFGIGISPEDKKKLFDRFYRAQTPFVTPGLGIGLYISRQIMLRHSGDIRVESEQGKGSTFTIVLPSKISA